MPPAHLRGHEVAAKSRLDRRAVYRGLAGEGAVQVDEVQPIGSRASWKARALRGRICGLNVGVLHRAAQQGHGLPRRSGRWRVKDQWVGLSLRSAGLLAKRRPPGQGAAIWRDVMLDKAPRQAASIPRRSTEEMKDMRTSCWELWPFRVMAGTAMADDLLANWAARRPTITATTRDHPVHPMRPVTVRHACGRPSIRPARRSSRPTWTPDHLGERTRPASRESNRGCSTRRTATGVPPRCKCRVTALNVSVLRHGHLPRRRHLAAGELTSHRPRGAGAGLTASS